MFRFWHHCDMICKKRSKFQNDAKMIEFDQMLRLLKKCVNKTSNNVIMKMMWLLSCSLLIFKYDDINAILIHD